MVLDFWACQKSLSYTCLFSNAFEYKNYVEKNRFDFFTKLISNPEKSELLNDILIV